MFSVSVNQFGPIDSGSIQLRPLTVLVGPNNAGKSYIAQLIYAISRTSSDLAENYDHFDYGFRPSLAGFPDRYDISDSFSNSTLDFVKKLLPPDFDFGKRQSASARHKIKIVVDELPNDLRESVDSHLRQYVEAFSSLLIKEMERCYDAKIRNLVSKSDPTNREFALSVENVFPSFNLSFVGDVNNHQEIKRFISAGGSLFEVSLPRPERLIPQRYNNETVSDTAILESAVKYLTRSIVLRSEDILNKVFPIQSFYLPAARSGIMLGQKAIARFGLRRLQRAGIEPISIPRLPGSVIDFLDAIYSIDRDQKGEFDWLAKELENEMTPGRIELVEGREELPEIYFRQAHIGRLSLNRTSSMISELAPIVLLLRYLIRRGDIFIVEEPESHMHPRAQRIMAKTLVKLANKGVAVLLTTHSDYLLEQLSNLVALSTKPREVIKHLNYEASELLTPDQVAVYLFKSGSGTNGSTVSPVEVGDTGIKDEDFGSVAESLYQEALDVTGGQE